MTLLCILIFPPLQVVHTTQQPYNILHLSMPNQLSFAFFCLISSFVVFANTSWDCDVSQLVEGSHLDEEGYLITASGEQIDLNDVDVNVEVDFNDITLVENEEDGMVYGTVISSIYKGDHYQIIVRTNEEEEDYILDTEYTYNVNDTVGIVIPSEKIKMSLKVAANAK